MNALDIISVEQAQSWLSAPDDTDLERLIRSAINFVENYTGHTLIEKEVEIILPSYCHSLRFYPMEILSVTNAQDVGIPYTVRPTVYKTYIYAPYGSKVTLLLGYKELGDIPGMLIEVAYKMLTYLYENRDIYTASLPQDFQVMINKYRRNLV